MTNYKGANNEANLILFHALKKILLLSGTSLG